MLRNKWPETRVLRHCDTIMQLWIGYCLDSGPVLEPSIGGWWSSQSLWCRCCDQLLSLVSVNSPGQVPGSLVLPAQLVPLTIWHPGGEGGTGLNWSQPILVRDRKIFVKIWSHHLPSCPCVGQCQAMSRLCHYSVKFRVSHFRLHQSVCTCVCVWYST